MAAKKKPARKARRKAREWELRVNANGGVLYAFCSQPVTNGTSGWEWVRVREVLPRKRGGKR